MQEIGKERKKFLVQEVVTPSTDGPEQGTEEKEIVVGLLGHSGHVHGFVDDGVQVRLVNDDIVMFTFVVIIVPIIKGDYFVFNVHFHDHEIAINK